MVEQEFTHGRACLTAEAMGWAVAFAASCSSPSPEVCRGQSKVQVTELHFWCLGPTTHPLQCENSCLHFFLIQSLPTSRESYPRTEQVEERRRFKVKAKAKANSVFNPKSPSSSLPQEKPPTSSAFNQPLLSQLPGIRGGKAGLSFPGTLLPPCLKPAAHPGRAPTQLHCCSRSSSYQAAQGTRM